MSKTKFIFSEDGKPLGRVDSNGNIYTMDGKPSYPYYHTKIGTAINKSHLIREAAAMDVTFEPEFNPNDVFED